jgi:hypothetical protein
LTIPIEELDCSARRFWGEWGWGYLELVEALEKLVLLGDEFFELGVSFVGVLVW